MKILITGTAGFIGFHLVNKIASTKHLIFGIDNINDYYDIRLKFARLEEAGIDTERIKKQESYSKKNGGQSSKNIATNKRKNDFIQSNKFKNYRFLKFDLQNKDYLEDIFKKNKFDYVIHLAAQAGVRYSIKNPQVYIDSNLTGFFNLLEACRKYPPRHFIFASSSSVYGNRMKVPFSENDNTDKPVSLYAATKKANEVIAHSYSSLYKIPITGFRFFTVYGPWGRPDMAYYRFVEKISRGYPIEIFHKGKLLRDFTYISDIVDGISDYLKLVIAKNKKITDWQIFNLGNNKPVRIDRFIKMIEKITGKNAEKTYLPFQKGDVFKTYANIKKIARITGFRPKTDLKKGLERFYSWYQKYHKNI